MKTVIGISGTAKNTGKTTTLLEIINFFRRKGRDVFLTSIGYDGEDFDNITGLPKPRVTVPKGAAVASALQLLESSSCSFVDLKDTGVRCALGRIFTGKATSEGKVVLAGPTNSKDVHSVIGFAAPGSIVLLDGAFSRLSPMVGADFLILATGAARNKDSHRIAKEVNAIFRVMSLPKAPENSSASMTVSGGLFIAGQGQELGWRLNGNRQQGAVRVQGIVNPKVFGETLKELRCSSTDRECGLCQSLTFIFDHPIMLLLSGDPLLWVSMFDTLADAQCRVMVRSSTKLLGVTVNPYLPSKSETGKYVADYVPPKAFLEDIRNLSNTPCTDIILEGPEKLYSWLDKLEISEGMGYSRSEAF